MLQTLHHSSPSPTLDPSRHISLLALSSTISRLISGLLSDYMSSPHRNYPISRIPLFLLLCLLHVSALLFLGYAPVAWLREWFALGSVFVGIGYGGIFTLAPTVVSVVWGIGGFGRNWGILTFTPGTRPLLFLSRAFSFCYFSPDSVTPRVSLRHYGLYYLRGLVAYCSVGCNCVWVIVRTDL
jgi:MFS family permease